LFLLEKKQANLAKILLRNGYFSNFINNHGIKIMANEITAALNTQLNNEFYSAYLYLKMAAYFKSNNLLGFAKWLELQAQEEVTHALKFYNFILERNLQLDLLPIQASASTWQTPLEIFTAALNHEQLVTQMINNLVKLANEVNDYATNIFLQWFVTEQIEEETTFSEILTKLKLAGDSSAALLLLDTELAKRAP
jgi:ferritin